MHTSEESALVTDGRGQTDVWLDSVGGATRAHRTMGGLLLCLSVSHSLRHNLCAPQPPAAPPSTESFIISFWSWCWASLFPLYRASLFRCLHNHLWFISVTGQRAQQNSIFGFSESSVLGPGPGTDCVLCACPATAPCVLDLPGGSPRPHTSPYCKADPHLTPP